MKTTKIIASLIFAAGILLCGGTNFEVFAAEEETSEREIDDSYKDCYEMGVELQITETEDSYHIESPGKTIIWDSIKVDEDRYTSCNAFARKMSPNTTYKDETIIPAGTEIKRVGISENGWDVIEYEDELYLMWYNVITEDKPVIITSTPSSSDSTSETTFNDEGSGNGYIGVYQLTAYTWTGNPCANGNYPTAGYTCACNSLPLGTVVYIEGYGTYVVEDTGGMGGGVIDIYMDSYDACIQFGRQSANVYYAN
ncbi:MAG TPA: hypothetical protein DCL29_02030 [Eubacterium sp.]|nr:hypothetical protein [Eubacterium sp.]